jgi:hypothetical protein
MCSPSFYGQIENEDLAIHRPMMKKTPLVCHDPGHFSNKQPQKNPQARRRITAYVLGILKKLGV